jgi:hypothetical protein
MITIIHSSYIAIVFSTTTGPWVVTITAHFSTTMAACRQASCGSQGDGGGSATVHSDRHAQCAAVVSARANSGWAPSFQFHQPPPIAVRNCTVSR